MDKPPYLALINSSKADPLAEEFLPLPFYPWEERPEHLALDFDEMATAIHLAAGDIPDAAKLLRVPHAKLSRQVRISPRLQRIQTESLNLVREKAEHEVISGLDHPDARRREWAAGKVLSSRLAMGSPLSPAPAASIQSDASLTVNAEKRSFTFRWRTAQDSIADDSGGGDSE